MRAQPSRHELGTEPKSGTAKFAQIVNYQIANYPIANFRIVNYQIANYPIANFQTANCRTANRCASWNGSSTAPDERLHGSISLE